jgi:hypothetical protein
MSDTLRGHLGVDGKRWASEFRATALRLGYSDMDEGWLLGWYANALVAGSDEGERRREAEHDMEIARLREALVWYEEQARLVQRYLPIQARGYAGRRALVDDGGARALAALHQREEVRSDGRG